MAIGASLSRGLGGGLLVLAGLVAVGAIIAFSTGLSWVNDAQETGNDDKGEAGGDLFMGGAIAFGGAVIVGFIGGVLFFTGGAMLRRYEAKAAQNNPLPRLPTDDDS